MIFWISDCQFTFTSTCVLLLKFLAGREQRHDLSASRIRMRARTLNSTRGVQPLNPSSRHIVIPPLSDAELYIQRRANTISTNKTRLHEAQSDLSLSHIETSYSDMSPLRKLHVSSMSESNRVLPEGGTNGSDHPVHAATTIASTDNIQLSRGPASLPLSFRTLRSSRSASPHRHNRHRDHHHSKPGSSHTSRHSRSRPPFLDHSSRHHHEHDRQHSYHHRQDDDIHDNYPKHSKHDRQSTTNLSTTATTPSDDDMKGQGETRLRAELADVERQLIVARLRLAALSGVKSTVRM